MASRQVKKLLKQRDAELLEQLAGAAEQDGSEEGEEVDSKPFNPFDLLDDEDQQDQPAVDDENEEVEEETAPAASAATTTAAKPSNASKSSKSKKGKKKGKLKGSKASAAAEDGDGVAGAAAAAAGAGNGQEEDIDALVQQLNLQTVGATQGAGAAGAAGAGAAGSAAMSPTCQLLGVDTSALRGDEELRRIFGANVIASVDREEMADAANRRRMAAMARGRPGAAAALRRARKGLLVSPKDHWPPLESGISMEYLGVQEGVRVFRYSWSPGYHHTQRTFEQCQASHDPNAIAALLQHAPYHVDSLLAMYDLYRHLGENQYAEEVLHRALHALEVAWHPQFDIRTANCRLDFEVPENQGLFLALFRHVQGLSRAGCHRTALEVAKLLLALQPDDPMGVLVMMDYLAIRAGRYEYLPQLVAGWEADTALSLRPNFSYGLALAAFRLEQQQQGGAASSSGQSSASSQPQGGPALPGWQPARDLLVGACVLHPSVVPRLLSKLQEKGSGREAHWARLLERRLFKQPHDAGSTTLHHLGSLYVERSALLWKAPDALEFLRAAATRAADMAEAGSIKRSGTAAGEGAEEGEVGGLSVEQWAGVRQSIFPDDEGRNEFRHLHLADFTDNVNALPREELGPAAVPAPVDAAGAAAARAAGGRPRRGGAAAAAADGVGHDMMGQVDPQVLEELQQQMILAQQAAGGAAGAAAMPEEELRGANPLYMLLRSLLPWVNAGQQPEYTQDDEQQPPNGSGGQ